MGDRQVARGYLPRVCIRRLAGDEGGMMKRVVVGIITALALALALAAPVAAQGDPLGCGEAVVAGLVPEAQTGELGADLSGVATGAPGALATLVQRTMTAAGCGAGG